MWLVTVLAFFIGIQGAMTGVHRVRTKKADLTGRPLTAAHRAVDNSGLQQMQIYSATGHGDCP